MKPLIAALLIATAPAPAIAGCGGQTLYVDCFPRNFNPDNPPWRKPSEPVPDMVPAAAATAALAGLTMPTLSAGQTGWAIAAGGISTDAGEAPAIGAGLAYGLSDQVTIYGKVAASEGAQAAFVGIGGRF